MLFSTARGVFVYIYYVCILTKKFEHDRTELMGPNSLAHTRSTHILKPKQRVLNTGIRNTHIYIQIHI